MTPFMLAFWSWFHRHIAAFDPAGIGSLTWDEDPIKASDVLATPGPIMRIIPWNCQRPLFGPMSGSYVAGWRVFAHNDAERAEILCSRTCHTNTSQS